MKVQASRAVRWPHWNEAERKRQELASQASASAASVCDFASAGSRSSKGRQSDAPGDSVSSFLAKMRNFCYQLRMNPDTDTLQFTAAELCSRIEKLTANIMSFWKNAHGWAPMEASGLLNKSMLEWQVSLAASLKLWITSESDGNLILAWANLGALVEGQLKLFLCVYYNDYVSDIGAIQKRGKLADPDICELEALRQFFVRRIWTVGANWNDYVSLVQQRRNAIHAFRHRDIGTFEEWQECLRLHLSFVRDVGGGLPYPDEQFMPLREK